MNCEILVVSCQKHFDWLEYCLRSIAKFATGFSGVTIIVPEPDLDVAVKRWFGQDFGPVTQRWPKCGEEWPEKGMLWHMAQILKADEWCPHADFILHTDSDALFVEPISPEDYVKDGKAILYHERFDSIGRAHPDVLRWQQVTQNCLTFLVVQETMRKLPLVYHRGVYAKAREEIERKTGKPWDEYIRSCENTFPQSFCEHNTLGNVAMQYFPNDYWLLDMERNPWPPQKLSQFWGHSPPHIPQRPIYKGQPFECTPASLLGML